MSTRRSRMRARDQTSRRTIRLGESLLEQPCLERERAQELAARGPEGEQLAGTHAVTLGQVAGDPGCDHRLLVRDAAHKTWLYMSLRSDLAPSAGAEPAV